MWGWLIAAAAVARVIYVSAVKQDRGAPPGSAPPAPATFKSGCVVPVVTLLGVLLAVYGVVGLLVGEPGVFVIAVLLLGIGRILAWKG